MGAQSLLKGISVGQKHRQSRKFTWKDVHQCAELTGDYNPMYLDEDFVRDTRFQKPIIHGLLTEGLVLSLASSYVPGSGAVLLHKEIVYRHPVFVGDTIVAELEVIDMNYERNWLTIQVSCGNQHQKEVLRGQLVLLIEKRRFGGPII